MRIRKYASDESKKCQVIKRGNNQICGKGVRFYFGDHPNPAQAKEIVGLCEEHARAMFPQHFEDED